MKLKELVPEPDLCEKIPPNEFDGSVFAWHLRIETGELFVAIRGSSNPDVGIILFAPAPTLAEIMAALRPGHFCLCAIDRWYRAEAGTSAATAALRVWLEVEEMKK